jgi:hypothetical protein
MITRISAFVAIIFLSTEIEAKPVPEFGPHIPEFTQAFFEKGSNRFRSGEDTPERRLFPEQASTSDFPDDFDKLEPEKDAESWRAGIGEEYLVEFGTEQAGFASWLRDRFKDYKFARVEYDESDSCHKFIVAHDSSTRFAGEYTSETKSIAMDKAMRIARKALKDFKGRMEYENVETEYTDGKITSLSVRFRRIFKNALVRGNVSYAYVTIGGKGDLREIRVKWPRFSKIPGWNEPMSREKAFEVAKSRMSEMPNSRDGQREYEAIRSTASSMALAWLTNAEDGRIVLTPGLSFIADVVYGNGDILHPPVDAPLLKKYDVGR